MLRAVDYPDEACRALIENGRPDLVDIDFGHMNWSDLQERPWAGLAVAAALIARDPRDQVGASVIESARRGFAAIGDADGDAYCDYVTGTRHLGIGEWRLAAVAWESACATLGDKSPVVTHALAHLSIAAYHDGDLTSATRLAEEAIGMARLRLDRRGEGLALIYSGLISLGLGEFGACLAAADSADLVFAELPDVAERYEWPLVAAERIAAYGHLGDTSSALDWAAEALDRARQVGTKWYEGIIRAVRAEFCAVADPMRSIADGRAALEILRAVGDPWWESCALRGMAIATDLTGHPAAAVRLLHDAAEISPGKFERARCDLLLAELLVRENRGQEAHEPLRRCIDVFRHAPADYFLCRALRVEAQVEPSRGPVSRSEARARRRTDTAFEQIFSDGWADGRSVQVRCFHQVAVSLEGEPAHFLTHNAERAFLILALAGEAGVHQEILSETLWPDAPRDRARQRIRTLLWQVRVALGDESWRLRRRGQLITLDTTDASVDLRDAIVEARSLAASVDSSPECNRKRLDLASRLEGPILSAYQYEVWAEEWIERAITAAITLRQRATGQAAQDDTVGI